MRRARAAAGASVRKPRVAGGDVGLAHQATADEEADRRQTLGGASSNPHVKMRSRR